ncbi:MAG TPA: site-2 protease family protein [Planctomycetes bacterium]|nr:site-2 protease family protein [Planctomycetota bacterium]
MSEPTSIVPGPLESTDVRPKIRRRIVLPVCLFYLTCLSTFWAGSTGQPIIYIQDSLNEASLMPIRAVLGQNWHLGLSYMAAILGILFAHEMGHFLATLKYRIPASLPFFLPLPISMIGTIGAVIGMDGRRANRKEIFDIGIAGPLAGLVVALPVMWYGVTHLELHTENGEGSMVLGMPLLVQWMIALGGPDVPAGGIPLGHLFGNPFFLAGWVGLLITGLNMLPASQLDGGHVLYCVFGRAARHIARVFILAAIGFILSDIQHNQIWILMTVLVLFMGVTHPPTKDDSVDIGWFRRILGVVSLTIPLLCFPPNAIQAL